MEERLASLEAKVEGVAGLRRDMNVRFTEVNERFIELRNDMNVRFAEVNGRITELRDDANRRIGALDAKVDRHFVWLMGMMVTGFITVIGALVGSW